MPRGGVASTTSGSNSGPTRKPNDSVVQKLSVKLNQRDTDIKKLVEELQSRDTVINSLKQEMH
jgi:hypothetical protein